MILSKIVEQKIQFHFLPSQFVNDPLRMIINIIGIRTEEGADNQSGTWTEITTMKWDWY